MSKLNDRTGERNINRYGSVMVIEKYNSYRDISVRFVKSNYLVKTQYEHFLKGSVSNPFDKSAYGVGFIGEGKYQTWQNGRNSPHYQTWHSMLRRCYSEKYQTKHPTYIGCTVDSTWHNFQTFAKWYDQNYYEVEGQKMNLDKDILFKGNKLYS